MSCGFLVNKLIFGKHPIKIANLQSEMTLFGVISLYLRVVGIWSQRTGVLWYLSLCIKATSPPAHLNQRRRAKTTARYKRCTTSSHIKFMVRKRVPLNHSRWVVCQVYLSNVGYKSILAVVTLQTFYPGKFDLLTVYLGKLDFYSDLFLPR